MFNKIIKIFLIIGVFSIFNLCYAFDAVSTHPKLTEEIVKYYNYFAERKINAQELELLKQGSILEDKSPRWINHYYDILNNAGINMETFRGNKFLFSLFLKTLPHYPLKTPEWSQDEIAQVKYLANRTYQFAKREYFNNKDLAFLSLGYLLHLLADMGVPDHARGDSHAGLFGDPKSNYEEYAKRITDNYDLHFASPLIQRKEEFYNYKDLNSIFDSLAKFTASNWFSEDTIGTLKEPKKPQYKKEFYDKQNVGYYYLYFKDPYYSSPILKEIKYIRVLTTNDDMIHYYWFNSVVPEIIKHGANLLNMYFSEIKEMEKEEALKLYEEDIGRKLNFIKFFNFWTYLPNYFKAELWYSGESVYKGVATVANIFTKQFQPQATKGFWGLEETKLAYKETKAEETKIEETKYEERIKYEETKKPENKNFQQSQIIEEKKQDEKKEEINKETLEEILEKEETPKYIPGGGRIGLRDPCEDYKNNTYPNILISEIKVEGDNPDDEYIELYNPSENDINLTCWFITKVSSEGNESTIVPASKFKDIKIPAKSFVLISHPSSTYVDKADIIYAKSYSISKNNSIILKKPNGDISDLVGFGSKKDKIFKYEGEPFIADNFSTSSIQRLGLNDSDNNSKDFWLYQPTPKTTREDFVDLRNINIEDFSITFALENGTITISFTEPDFNIATTNYSYEILISTSSNFSTYKLKDFGAENDLPRPTFKKEKYNFEDKLKKCPINESIWYFGLYLYDNLILENKTNIFATSVNLENFCEEKPKQKTENNKILISEIMIGGEKADDEYIELYNPNDEEIDLTGWKLLLIKNGKIQTIVGGRADAKFDNIIIKPYSYLLLANASSNLTYLNIKPDIIWAKSNKLTDNDSIALVNSNDEIVDLVGWGFNDKCEGMCLNNPQNIKAFVRKAGTSSTEDSMKNKEKYFGNIYDTDNNSIDFILMDPEPQNSQSLQEIPPDYITKLNFDIEKNIIKLNFTSPYKKLTNAIYEIRKGIDWDNGEKLNLQLPEVKPFGENESVIIDACLNNIQKGEKIWLGIIKDTELLNTTSTEISQEIDCNNAEVTIYFRDNEREQHACSNFYGIGCECGIYVRNLFIKNFTLNKEYPINFKGSSPYNQKFTFLINPNDKIQISFDYEALGIGTYCMGELYKCLTGNLPTGRNPTYCGVRTSIKGDDIELDKDATEEICCPDLSNCIFKYSTDFTVPENINKIMIRIEIPAPIQGADGWLMNLEITI